MVPADFGVRLEVSEVPGVRLQTGWSAYAKRSGRARETKFVHRVSVNSINRNLA